MLDELVASVSLSELELVLAVSSIPVEVLDSTPVAGPGPELELELEPATVEASDAPPVGSLLAVPWVDELLMDVPPVLMPDSLWLSD